MSVIWFVASVGIPIMLRPQTRHPLDPLSAAEISVAVATVRAAGATPEVVNFTVDLFLLLFRFLKRNSSEVEIVG